MQFSQTMFINWTALGNELFFRFVVCVCMFLFQLPEGSRLRFEEVVGRVSWVVLEALPRHQA